MRHHVGSTSTLLCNAILLGCCLAISLPARAQQVTCTFDEAGIWYPTSGGPELANGYQGLNWTNVFENNLGLRPSITAYNGYTNQFEFSSPSSLLTLNNLQLAGFLGSPSGGSGFNVTITGYRGGVSLWNYAINNVTTTLLTYQVDSDLLVQGVPASNLQVDRVVIQPSQARYFEVDNLTFTPASSVPETSTLLMSLCGLGALGGLARRWCRTP